MNSKYRIEDNEIIVSDYYGHITKREMSDNIEDILVTENNIEEIQKLLVKEKKRSKEI